MTKQYDKRILPENWKWVKLKEISESIQYGYTESSSKNIIGPKFLRITDIQENKVNWDEVPYCKIDKDAKKKYLLSSGDLLFARTGATVGKSFLIKGEIPEAVFASYLIRVRVSKEINERFLSNFFHSPFYWAQITEGQVGIGQPNVNGTKLGQLDFPLPPKTTQLAIVSKIEELFSEIEKGIKSLFTAKEQLKTYRQSVLKWAFEGKLSELRFTGFKDDKIKTTEKDDSAEILKSSNPKNHSSDKGELPEGWKWVQIKDVAETYGGYAFKSGEFKKEGKYQVLRMGNIRPGILRYDESPVFLDGMNENVLSRSLLQINDVIITQTGTRKKRDYGFTVLIPKNNLLLNQRIAAIRFAGKYLPKFFLYFSWTDSFKDQFFANETGNVGQGNVGMKAVTETLVPFCTIKEQNIIVQAIESRFSVADKMEESITESLQQAEALKQSILKKAFEGRLI